MKLKFILERFFIPSTFLLMAYIYLPSFQIYRICCITLGTPPKTVKFQYYNKDKEGKQEHKCLGPMSPRDFYHTLIKPDCLDMEDLVSGIHQENISVQ